MKKDRHDSYHIRHITEMVLSFTLAATNCQRFLFTTGTHKFPDDTFPITVGVPKCSIA